MLAFAFNIKEKHLHKSCTLDQRNSGSFILLATTCGHFCFPRL